MNVTGTWNWLVIGSEEALGINCNKYIYILIEDRLLGERIWI